MNALENALQLLRSNRPIEAEAVVAEAVKEAKARAGEQSAEYAAAEFGHAQILAALGDLHRSGEAMRRAAEVPAATPDARRAQLTYLSNLGELLLVIGRGDEAQRALEESLQGRLEMYGEGTEGHAIGQEPMAALLLARGQLDEAEELVEDASGVLWHAHNGRVVSTLALRAAIRATKYGDERPLLEHLEVLPRPLQLQLVGACLERSGRDEPVAALLVLQELRERLEDLEDVEDSLVQVLAAKARIARVAGDHAQREEALDWIWKHFDAKDDPRQSLKAWLGLAMARDEAGNPAGAEEAYREAARRADAIGDDAIRAQVRRNTGLFLAKHERHADAEASFEEAIACAERSGDSEQLGTSLVARGIHLQHQGRSADARVPLARALEVLPAEHPDLMFARDHLEAIDKQRPCNCSNMGKALSEAIEAKVRPQVPEGLLEEISVAPGGGLEFRIALKRPPTPEERELLDRVLRQALAQIRESMHQQGLA